MTPRIYPSTFPSLPIQETSIFSHLFYSTPNDPSLVGGYPGDYPAYIDAASGTTLNRKQTKEFALKFAYGLRNHPRTKLSRGQTVLVYTPNSFIWPVVLFGSIATGLNVSLANSAYTSDELAFQYNETKPTLVICAEESLSTVLTTFKHLGITPEAASSKILILGASLKWAGGPDVPSKSAIANLLRFEDLLSLGQLEVEEKFDGKLADQVALMCFSSGTSGKPKGVMTSHKNLTSVVDITSASLPEVRPKDSAYAILPFYHIYGAVNILQVPFRLGANIVIAPRFDPERFCRDIETYKIKVAFIVPPILVILAHHPIVEKYDLSSLEVLTSGAAPLGSGLVKAVSERLTARSKTGVLVTVNQGYGLTETSPTAHLLLVKDAFRKVGSIGLLLPNLEARIVVEGDSEHDAADGEPGELWVRGPSIMKGYLNRPDATAEVLTHDGFFRTGDVAVRDPEGFYYIVDRLKELIKYKGFQVPPAELEGVLLGHPDINDAAVIGIEDIAEATELPRAYVVHARPDTVQTQEAKDAFAANVQDWIKGKVAKHKYLRGGVVIIDAVPKSAAGKILRRQLRERAKKEVKMKAKL